MASYSAPVAYAAAAPQLGIPAILDSDPLLQFKGARSVLKNIPAATGSAVGPSSQVQFLMPQSMNGFVKPGSMYIKCRVDVTFETANAANRWSFAGQSGGETTVDTAGPSPASSLFDRITVTFPGGVQLGYNSYDKFEWGLTLAHMVSREYVLTDLRMLQHCNTIRSNATDTVVSKAAIVCIPLNLPCFNAPSAVPLCLLSGGITIDVITNTIAQAFTSAQNKLTNFAISEMTLVYEEIQVSPEFKAVLREKTAMQPYSIGLADRTWLGVCDGKNTVRVNVGVGLSSMKALVGLNVNSVTDTLVGKVSKNNGLERWNLFINGQQVNSMNLDTDTQCYAEFTRAIQSLYDIDRVSTIWPYTSESTSTLRSTYQAGQFAFGFSTAVYSDVNFALSGLPVDQLSVEFIRSAAHDVVKWGGVQTNDDGYSTYLWALHDSVLTILPDGTVSLRK